MRIERSPTSIALTQVQPFAMASLLRMALAMAALFVLAGPMIASAQPAAPAPKAAPGPPNITAILVKGGNYNFFMRLLQETRIDEQITSQLNNSYNGLTVFAPSDDAFNSLKSGTLNSLTQQEQIELVLYHVLPQFYTMSLFQTASNPLNTQASSKEGVDTLNVTASSSGNQLNVSTGVVETQVNNALYSTMPLAVYSVEKVLLPYDLFGTKAPASSPPSTPAAPGSTNSPTADENAASGPSAGEGKNGAIGLRAEWSTLLAGLGLLGVAANLL